MLASLLISALTCLALEWVNVHQYFPRKEHVHASAKDEPR